MILASLSYRYAVWEHSDDKKEQIGKKNLFTISVLVGSNFIVGGPYTNRCSKISHKANEWFGWCDLIRWDLEQRLSSSGYTRDVTPMKGKFIHYQCNIFFQVYSRLKKVKQDYWYEKNELELRLITLINGYS